jgi:hypothetical protein
VKEQVSNNKVQFGAGVRERAPPAGDEDAVRAEKVQRTNERETGGEDEIRAGERENEDETVEKEESIIAKGKSLVERCAVRSAKDDLVEEENEEERAKRGVVERVTCEMDRVREEGGRDRGSGNRRTGSRENNGRAKTTFVSVQCPITTWIMCRSVEDASHENWESWIDRAAESPELDTTNVWDQFSNRLGSSKEMCSKLRAPVLLITLAPADSGLSSAGSRDEAKTSEACVDGDWDRTVCDANEHSHRRSTALSIRIVFGVGACERRERATASVSQGSLTPPQPTASRPTSAVDETRVESPTYGTRYGSRSIAGVPNAELPINKRAVSRESARDEEGSRTMDEGEASARRSAATRNKLQPSYAWF